MRPRNPAVPGPTRWRPRHAHNPEDPAGHAAARRRRSVVRRAEDSGVGDLRRGRAYRTRHCWVVSLHKCSMTTNGRPVKRVVPGSAFFGLRRGQAVIERRCRRDESPAGICFDWRIGELPPKTDIDGSRRDVYALAPQVLRGAAAELWAADRAAGNGLRNGNLNSLPFFAKRLADLSFCIPSTPAGLGIILCSSRRGASAAKRR